MKKIFLRGVDQKIKNELWPRLDPKSKYVQMVETATLAEAVVMKKESEPRNLDLIAVVTSKELEHKRQLENT